ncbi:MAG: lysylphosphatidylglycerol synthase domain-containing protein [Burkholderiaceae bacterium]
MSESLRPRLTGAGGSDAAIAASRTRSRARWVRGAILAASLVGLSIAVWAVARSDLTAIATTARRIGITGFLIYCSYSLGVFGLLGGAWLVVSGTALRRIGVFIGGRMLREAASDLLPFSQIGGILISVRLLISHGVTGGLVGASLIADLTTEMASQLVFTVVAAVLAAAFLIDRDRADAFGVVLVASMATMAIIIVIAASAPRWLPRVGQAIAQRFLPQAVVVVDQLAFHLDAIYARRAGLLASFLINLAAWIASAAGAWVALRLMQVELPIASILALEALVFASRSAAFMIPGGLGVQEATYALAAPLFGLPVESVLALALVKRMRDLAIGIPTLLVWQGIEARAVHRESRPLVRHV